VHFCKRTPNVLRVLIEREEKGLKSWGRKTVVSEMGRKWVPVRWAGISKCTSAICSKSDMREVQVTAVSWSQVAATRNTRDWLAVTGHWTCIQESCRSRRTQTLNRTWSTTFSQCSSLRQKWVIWNPYKKLLVVTCNQSPVNVNIADVFICFLVIDSIVVWCRLCW